MFLKFFRRQVDGRVQIAGHFPGPEIVVALGVNDDLGAVAVFLDGENDLGAQDDFKMAGDPFQFFSRVVGQRGGQFDVPGRDVNLHGGHPSIKTGIEINSLYNFTLGVSNQGAEAFPSQPETPDGARGPSRKRRAILRTKKRGP
jgi:hypothetical protein